MIAPPVRSSPSSAPRYQGIAGGSGAEGGGVVGVGGGAITAPDADVGVEAGAALDLVLPGFFFAFSC